MLEGVNDRENFNLSEQLLDLLSKDIQRKV